MPLHLSAFTSLLPAKGDVVKIAGGGVLGWFGRLWQDHSKRTTMRRHLYLELARNYCIFCEVMTSPESLSQYPEWRDYPVQTKYYEYALKDMDTFHSLYDYGYLSSIFDEIALTRGLRGQDLSHRVWNIKEGITSGLLAGAFDKRLLLKHAAEEHKEYVERELSRVESQRKEAAVIRQEASRGE